MIVESTWLLEIGWEAGWLPVRSERPTTCPVFRPPPANASVQRLPQ